MHCTQLWLMLPFARCPQQIHTSWMNWPSSAWKPTTISTTRAWAYRKTHRSWTTHRRSIADRTHSRIWVKVWCQITAMPKWSTTLIESGSSDAIAQPSTVCSWRSWKKLSHAHTIPTSSPGELGNQSAWPVADHSHVLQRGARAENWVNRGENPGNQRCANLLQFLWFMRLWPSSHHASNQQAFCWLESRAGVGVILIDNELIRGPLAARSRECIYVWKVQ